MAVRAVDAEELDHRAEREHEVVEADRVHVLELRRLLVEVDRGRARLVDRDVRLVVEEIAQRVRHDRRVDQTRRELIQHRLERVVVARVDEHDVDVGFLQLARGTEAGKAATENQDLLPGHVSVRT